MKENNGVAVFALGGLDEIGKNTYCYETEQDLVMIDAGMSFPDDDIPGIDYVIPDYVYLMENQAKLKALIVTHGHEDHIGGIPFLLQKVHVPIIYASKLTIALIRNKLEDMRIKTKTLLVEIDPTSNLDIGLMNFTFFNVTHSIPDALGVIIRSPHGNIVHTGDFKIDLTPVGVDFEFEKLAQIAKEGVTLLLSDSTNAEVEGYTLSEKEVAQSIRDVFRNARGRLLIATFASNVYRIQQIIETAVVFNRKISIFGRSMEKIVAIARQYGFIKCPDSTFVANEDLKTIKSDETLILCTGSQGEPMAALSRVATGQHRSLKIMPGDTVIFSSSPIPGNTASINKVVNYLARSGADVMTNSIFNNLHTTGHASKEELKYVLKILNPKYFMPVHGEYKMQRIHADIAKSVGIPESFILSNGDRLMMKDGVVTPIDERIDVESIYVEGSDASGQSTAIIRDRKVMSEDGVVAVIVTMDSRQNLILKYPTIISRGFVYIRECGDLITNAEKILRQALIDLVKTRCSFNDIKNRIRSVLGNYLFSKTHRNPMIIPVICNRKEAN